MTTPSTPDAARPAVSQISESGRKKQAVVLIHGIGEQRPMQTLRGFVRAVWTSDPDVWSEEETLPPGGTRGDIWTKPDQISGNLELRRITTREGRSGRRVDFFELYWAHLATGTKWTDVLSWTRTILVRPPWRVPAALWAAWLVIILVLVLAAAIILWSLTIEHPFTTIWQWLTLQHPAGASPLPAGVVAAIAALLVGILARAAQTLLISHVGDAARYLRATPDTVAMRTAIRKAGLELLARLHESDDFDRIVIVGHSLGTVIGYDILRHAWPRHNKHANPLPGRQMALTAMEALIREAPQQGFTARYRDAQADLGEELKRGGSAWRVTDFVTLGSPLAHAEVLIADTAEEFADKKAERELPSCPPTPEADVTGGSDAAPKAVISYPWPVFGPDRDKVRRLHHGAVFAPVRWTNLYFPSRAVVFGDVIGGPVRVPFRAEPNGSAGFAGAVGALDVSVRIDGGPGFLSHTKYWSSWRLKPRPVPHEEVLPDREASDHIRMLRAALNLGESAEREAALRDRAEPDRPGR